MATQPSDLIANLLAQYGLQGGAGPQLMQAGGGSAPMQRPTPRLGIFGNGPAWMASQGDAGQVGNMPTPASPEPQPNVDVTSAAPTGGMFGGLRRTLSGLGNAIDRVANPDTSTVGGRISQWGAYLGAASGSPLGEATIAMQKDRQPALNDQRQQAMWQQRYDQQRADQVADRDWKANQPRYFSGGQDQVRFDPRTGQTQTIFDAPMPAETYARNFGEPGSDEYRGALTDYTLRGWGDTAIGNRADLEDLRFGNRQALKQTPTYANLHPRAPAPRQPTVNSIIAGLLQKQNAGQSLSPGEQQTLSDYRSRTGGGGRAKAGAQSANAPVKVNTPDEARRLPKGTMFQTPDGRIKVAG